MRVLYLYTVSQVQPSFSSRALPLLSKYLPAGINALIAAGDLFMTDLAEVRKRPTCAIPALAIFLISCADPVQELSPPPDGPPTQTIDVSLDTWHAMIASTLN